jgi:flavin-binding protein dodecin
MSVVKIIRIVGNSPESWAKAAAAGVREAARTVRNIQGVEATDFTAKVDAEGRIKEYRCTMNIAFIVGGRGAAAAGSKVAKASGRR